MLFPSVLQRLSSVDLIICRNLFLVLFVGAFDLGATSVSFAHSVVKKVAHFLVQSVSLQLTYKICLTQSAKNGRLLNLSFPGLADCASAMENIHQLIYTPLSRCSCSVFSVLAFCLVPIDCFCKYNRIPSTHYFHFRQCSGPSCLHEY